MAAVTTYLRADALRKYHPTTPMVNHFSVVLPSTAADTAEWITLMNVPAGYVVQNLIWTISATLGASQRVKVRAANQARNSGARRSGPGLCMATKITKTLAELLPERCAQPRTAAARAQAR